MHCIGIFNKYKNLVYSSLLFVLYLYFKIVEYIGKNLFLALTNCNYINNNNYYFLRDIYLLGLSRLEHWLSCSNNINNNNNLIRDNNNNN